jgi:hypothetical protein
MNLLRTGANPFVGSGLYGPHDQTVQPAQGVVRAAFFLNNFET